MISSFAPQYPIWRNSTEFNYEISGYFRGYMRCFRGFLETFRRGFKKSQKSFRGFQRTRGVSVGPRKFHGEYVYLEPRNPRYSFGTPLKPLEISFFWQFCSISALPSHGKRDSSILVATTAKYTNPFNCKNNKEVFGCAFSCFKSIWIIFTKSIKTEGLP